jgi:hypothetical protein
MQLRVRNGKGAKGRVLPLSERLLKELENYRRAKRHGKGGHDIPWLFLGKNTGKSMGRCVGANIYYAYGTLQATPLQSHVRSYASTPIASPRKSPLVLPVRIIFALFELQTPILWYWFVTVSIRTDCFVRTSFEERR